MPRGGDFVKQVTLLYHDVIVGDDHLASGFSDAAARRYKLERADFVRHLDAIDQVISSAPVTVAELGAPSSNPSPLMLSFDDGGVSGLDVIAAELGRRGWPAHFFITTDYIGSPGFLDAGQIRKLREMGHLVGSHSCSHPHPMSSCSWDQLIDEWTRSIAKLSEILQEPVSIASIPGGAYRKHVAAAAAAIGITKLFTSEPVQTTWHIDSCEVLGRFCIVDGDRPDKSAALAAGRAATRAVEYIVWNGKQAAKRALGPHFARLKYGGARESAT